MAQDFPPLKNDLLLRAAKREKTTRAPVWIMRQAGRYLPEFREVRAQHDFFTICRTPTLACEITLQPIRRFTGLIDAAIIFSDILVVPQAMGMEVLMNPGPFFPDPLNSPEDIKKLSENVDVDKELGYVFEALTLTRKELKGEVPLIGFSGAPWTLFAYMVEGKGSKTFERAKAWLFKWPEETKTLLLRIANVIVDYLVGQVKAGAQLLQIFDSWASELSPYDFHQFSFPTLKLISTNLRARLVDANIPMVPLTLFAKGAHASLGLLAEEAGYDTLGLDWTQPPAIARQTVAGKVALQGNMDPGVLLGSREVIEDTVKRMCAEFGSEGGWIVNLGHGITPGIDPENVRWFFECVHKYSTHT
ncbi:Uroporphyrinogen decarboxylase [Flagelloscypha sp. PMI_526]|nr:Uroporphyrinogen decarboxylase [Flagelloscypha sp. PMI_526]